MSESVNSEAILEVSEAAVNKIAELIETRGKPDLVVRVAIRGRLPGGGFQTEFKFMGRDEADEGDLVQHAGSFDFLFQPEVAEKIKGSKVDFDESRYSAGFNIEYPDNGPYPPGVTPRTDWEDPTAIQVQKVIDEYINPGVAGHGGWVLLHDVKEQQAFVEMGGGCQGCGLSAVTLRAGIEEAIMHAVPEIKAVVDVTEHELGENPYYSAETAEGMKGASPFDK